MRDALKVFFRLLIGNAVLLALWLALLEFASQWGLFGFGVLVACAYLVLLAIAAHKISKAPTTQRNGGE